MRLKTRLFQLPRLIWKHVVNLVGVAAVITKTVQMIASSGNAAATSLVVMAPQKAPAGVVSTVTRRANVFRAVVQREISRDLELNLFTTPVVGILVMAWTRRGEINSSH
jgi:hypothetical protein